MKYFQFLAILSVIVTFLCQQDRPFHLPNTFRLPDDRTEYFAEIGNVSCFVRGTNLSATISDPGGCRCLEGYFGSDCGIPDAVWYSCLNGTKCSPEYFRVRNRPKRIIHAFNVNHEVEFFEIRMEEIGDVVDVFIVGESNFTARGDAKPLYLLPLLQAGFLSHLQKKMIHVLIENNSALNWTDGWSVDSYLRDFTGQKGLERVKGIRDDDLFLLLDADEIPSPEVLLFLKLYDGYPEPIALSMTWSVFGFFWKRLAIGSADTEDVTRVVAAASVRMIRQVYDSQVMSLRKNHVNEEPLKSRISNYTAQGGQYELWDIGRIGHLSGFHCSWCYTPEGIRIKMMSAQNSDQPRWGDDPDKLKVEYIRRLINTGQWFDGSWPFLQVDPHQDRHSAPSFVLRNHHRFTYLLNNSRPLRKYQLKKWKL